MDGKYILYKELIFWGGGWKFTSYTASKCSLSDGMFIFKFLE